MNQTAHCDWLPERTRWSHLARSGLPAVSRKQNFPKSHIINPLLTNFVRSRWLDIGLVLFLRVYEPRLRLGPYKQAKKELGQYPAILTSHLVNNPYISAILMSYDVQGNIMVTWLNLSARLKLHQIVPFLSCFSGLNVGLWCQ